MDVLTRTHAPTRRRRGWIAGLGLCAVLAIPVAAGAQGAPEPAPPPAPPPGSPSSGSAAPPAEPAPLSTSPAPSAPPSAAPAAPAAPLPAGPGPVPYGGPPPAWGPPAQYGAPSEYDAMPPWLRPRTLSYHEGQPIPNGYHLEDHPHTGLMIVGGSLFAGAYVVSGLTGGTMVSEREDSGAPLFIPVAGPFVTIGTTGLDFGDENERGAVVLLLFDGIAQVTGVTLFILGAALDRTQLVRDKYVGQAAPTHTAKAPTPTFDVSIGAARAAARLTF